MTYPGLVGEGVLLIATCIGFVSIGAVLGRRLPLGAAPALFIASVAMLVAQAVAGRRLRTGPVAVGWLCALGLLLGLGLGGTLAQSGSADPTSTAMVTAAAALLAASVGLFDVFVSRELPSWLDALLFGAFTAVVLGEVLVLFGTGSSPLPSLVVGMAVTMSVVVAVTHVQRRAPGRDAVSLATGAFVLPLTLLAAQAKLRTRLLTPRRPRSRD